MNDAKKNAALAGAAKGTVVSVNGKSDNSTGVDRLTVLETAGKPPNRLVFAKTHKADGTTKPYDHPKSVKFKVREVADLLSLAKLLKELRGNPYACLIGGAPLEDRDAMEAAPVGKPFVLRCKKNFVDQPLHTLMLDIDDYQPENYDPQTHPVLCIVEFIEKHLPEAFHKASFIWHLSNSAGLPGKEHVLKAHVWFWSRTPYSCSQYDAWALVAVNGCRRQKPLVVDTSIYSQEHVRYTADPVFEEGRPDPIDPKLRFGLYRHEDGTDVVDLVIGDDVLAAAQEIKNPFGRPGGSDVKLTDPSSKEGLIGAFHRAFDAERVLLDFLEGEFEQATERRYTWLNSDSGAPEGVWVTDDSMHVGASHNSWPFGPDRVVNLWDLVRVLKFGHLDIAGEDADDFDRLNIEQMPVGRRPSDAAMRRWAEGLPELKAAVAEERNLALVSHRERLRAASTESAVREVVCREIAADAELTATQREALAGEVQAALQRLVGHKPAIREARALIKPTRTEIDRPLWFENWVWLAEDDCFFDVETKIKYSERSFNAKYDRDMWPFANDNGTIPSASTLCLQSWGMRVVDRVAYAPQCGLFFELGSVTYVNSYRQDAAPALPESLDEDQAAAIRAVEAHAELLLPDERERTLFLDYLAFCVQNPGVKIRWAPLLKGVEGDGKSVFITLMQHVMGYQNVRVLDSSTLESSDFTAWRVGQCFVGVEEMKLHGHNRYDVYNKLKTALSNDFVEVHCKGKDPITVPNTSNFLLLTNFEDGVPVTDNDRRLMILRSPFLSKEDLAAGLGPVDRGILRPPLRPSHQAACRRAAQVAARTRAVRRVQRQRPRAAHRGPGDRRYRRRR